MAKVKISIYLIKDGVDIDSVVNTEKTDVVIHRCDDGSVVYTKLSIFIRLSGPTILNRSWIYPS